MLEWIAPWSTLDASVAKQNVGVRGIARTACICIWQVFNEANRICYCDLESGRVYWTDGQGRTRNKAFIYECAYLMFWISSTCTQVYLSFMICFAKQTARVAVSYVSHLMRWNNAMEDDMMLGMVGSRGRRWHSWTRWMGGWRYMIHYCMESPEIRKGEMRLGVSPRSGCGRLLLRSDAKYRLVKSKQIGLHVTTD